MRIFLEQFVLQKTKLLGLVLPTIGTYCMQQHVNEIAKCIEAGNHGVIVFDQVAWQRQRISRLVRKSVAFSKSFVNHMGAIRYFWIDSI
jgi:IS1 family transposase